MLNAVVLIGRLCADPELQYTQAGKAIANCLLAVDRTYKNAAGEKETDFINFTAWEKTAEFIGLYLTKGRLICIEARLQVDKWQTQDGQARQTLKVIADRCNALDKRPEGEQSAPRRSASPADDTVAGDGFDANMDVDDPFA